MKLLKPSVSSLLFGLLYPFSCSSDVTKGFYGGCHSQHRGYTLSRAWFRVVRNLFFSNPFVCFVLSMYLRLLELPFNNQRVFVSSLCNWIKPREKTAKKPDDGVGCQNKRHPRNGHEFVTKPPFLAIMVVIAPFTKAFLICSTYYLTMTMYNFINIR